MGTLAGSDKPHPFFAIDVFFRQRGRNRDAVFLGGVIAFARPGGRGHIEDEPYLLKSEAETVRVELFNDQAAGMGGSLPMDAAQAISADVLAHTGGAGTVLAGEPAAQILSLLLAGYHLEKRELQRHRVDHDIMQIAQLLHGREEPERVGDLNIEHPDTVLAAAHTARVGLPPVRATRSQVKGRPVLIARQIRVLLYLDQGQRHPALVGDDKLLFKRVAGIAAAGRFFHLYGDAADAPARPGPAEHQKDHQEDKETPEHGEAPGHGQGQDQKRYYDKRPSMFHILLIR